MMKFTMNHYTRFTTRFLPYLIGFLQVIASLWIEFINIFILLSNESVMDVVMNFLALNVILEFDNYYAASL